MDDLYVQQMIEISKEEGYVGDLEKSIDYLLDNDRTLIEREQYIQGMRACNKVEIAMRKL
tara:strand:+ start:152 stop:331 length:180 start_codon:yes stop_codon:yes gene_type:complete